MFHLQIWLINIPLSILSLCIYFINTSYIWYTWFSLLACQIPDRTELQPCLAISFRLAFRLAPKAHLWIENSIWRVNQLSVNISTSFSNQMKLSHTFLFKSIKLACLILLKIINAILNNKHRLLWTYHLVLIIQSWLILLFPYFILNFPGI